MNKRIEVNLIDPDFSHSLCQEFPTLYGIDIRNIIDKFGDRKITDEDAADALDLIAVYFWQRRIHRMVLDIDARNEALAPVKEMTIAEIEKQLGYSIKIVKEKEK